jgi:Mlc titration factor MtfA (ptsG expression regulator)
MTGGTPARGLQKREKTVFFGCMRTLTEIALIIGLVIAVTIIARLSRYVLKGIRTLKVTRIYDDRHWEFDSILSQYNPYYKSLDDTVRDRFLRRVLNFMEDKDFEYIDLEKEERMPLLISAAAVQLTFGLEHFLLDYFKTIYILKENYRFGLYNMPFEGHVSEDGIYLSWANFIREFTDYADGQNVGLHEMAHALTYVNFTVEDGKDDAFHDKFKDFSAVARPVFERMQAGEIIILDSYAATNYHEFWAVSIETFFERAHAFKKQLPELYDSLCILLNQDPLTPRKIIDPSILDDIADVSEVLDSTPLSPEVVPVQGPSQI